MTIAPPIEPTAVEVLPSESNATAPSEPTRRSWPQRLVQGRPEDPAWARPGLIALLVVTAGLYLWNLGSQGWANAFYAAAVQAGTKSWKAFFFGSFDSSNFITVDKPPASLWVMELSARAFGLNSWSMLVPQALEGVAAVGILYTTVKRWFSPAAGLIAGAVLALTPVAALMFRYNNPDSLLVLLLVAAAYATVRAVETGRTRWLVAAGSFVGFGFITKMLQAFVIIPVIGLVYLWAGPPELGRRIVQLLAGGLAVVVSAGWWVAAVMLTPAADRPYIGGSQNNSLFNVIFGYNGFGRITGNETGSVGGGGSGTSMWGPTGWTRMFNSTFGTQASWLIPAALVMLAAVLYLTWRAPRRDRTRAAFLLWGGWLIVTAAVFSFAQGIIHPYYTVALAPAIGALVGMGAVELWRHRQRWFARSALAASIGLTAWWAYAMLDRTPEWNPWLRTVVLTVGILAAIGVVVAPYARRSVRRGVVILGVGAALAGPLAFTIDVAATPASGAIPTAGPASTQGGFGGGFGGAFGPGARGGFTGPPGLSLRGGSTTGRFGAAGGRGARGLPPFASGGSGGTTGGTGRLPFGGAGGSRPGVTGGGGAGGLLNASSPSSALVKKLQANASHYSWVAAAVGANTAAGYQLGSGDPVMAIGGFNGTDPDPTLATFKKLVAEGKVHYFIASGGFGGGFAAIPGHLGTAVRGGAFPGATTGVRAGGFSAPAARAGGTGGAGGLQESKDSSAITAWVEAHFKSTTVGGVTLYNLTEPKG
jgi:4-amino-4-deoxy-L-arabinose transferase-like glycosyltransferase